MVYCLNFEVMFGEELNRLFFKMLYYNIHKNDRFDSSVNKYNVCPIQQQGTEETLACTSDLTITIDKFQGNTLVWKKNILVFTQVFTLVYTINQTLI